MTAAKKNSGRLFLSGVLMLLIAIVNIWTPYIAIPVHAEQTNSKKQLKRGMTGPEVSNLVLGLSNANYLKSDDVTNIHGNYIYDETVENAVSHFQRDLGLRADGIYDSKLNEILYIFWQPSYSSSKLGMRELSVKEGTTGADVDYLIELLENAGFPPDKSKLKLSKSPEYTEKLNMMFTNAGISIGEEIVAKQHYRYTKDIEKAVMTFQAFNGIKPTGKLTEETVKKLSIEK